MQQIKLFIINLLLLFSTIARSGDDYRIFRLTTDNGLTNNHVNAITQDSIGFLWLATADGLCRYDGYNFHRYKSSTPGESFHIGESVISSLLADKKGNLWVAAENIHLYQVEKNNFIEYVKPFSGKIQSIHETGNGQLLLSITEPVGFYLFSIETKKYSPVEVDKVSKGIQFNQLLTSFSDGNKNTFFSDYFNGKLHQCSFVSNSWILHSSYNVPNPIIAYLSHHQKIYLGSNQGELFVIHKNRLQLLENINKINKGQRTVIRSIAAENDSILWLGTDIGLIRFDINSKKANIINYYTEQSKPQNTNINQVFIDTYNQLWIATTNGISRINLWRYPIHYYKAEKDGLPDNQINAIYESPKGTMWIATGKGIASMDVATGKIKDYSSQNFSTSLFYSDVVYSIAEGPDKSLMIGSIGINQLDFNRSRFGYVTPNPSDPNGLRSWVIWKIHKGQKSGHYWIATLDGLEEMTFLTQNTQQGIYRMPVSFKHHSIVDSGSSMPCKNITDVYEDNNGHVWIASTCGLTLYNPQKNTYTNYTYHQDDVHSLGAKSVKCIMQDSKQQIWLGTEGGGLNRFDPKTGKFHRYRQKDGLTSDIIMGILEDNAGFLWMSTPLGISRLDPSTNKIKNYGYAEGFQGDMFNRGAYFKASDGRLYFGGINGLNSFDPSAFKEHPVKPSIVLTNLYLFNKTVNIGELINDDVVLSKSLSKTSQIKLNYKNNVLGIEFVALHFLSPAKNRYQYKLDGFENEWTTVSSNTRIANYMNLPAGKYTFMVKASNADDLWTEPMHALSIVVLPPFWNTWWFKIILFILLLILIVTFVRYRIHQVERQNDALEVLVNIRTNEIEQQKEELAAQADNLQETNYLLKENQDQLMNQSTELQVTNSALKLANTTKDTLFSIIAHDLKNPFQVILTTSQNLVRQYENLSEIKRMEYAEAINKSSNDIFILLQNLLEWSRSQMNKISFHPESLDLFNLCEEIIDVLQIQAKNKKVTIYNKFPKGFIVDADRNLMATVFRNLISNGIKFNKIGGSVSINAYQIEQHCEIIISDTGIGIHKEKIDKLFSLEEHFTTSGTSGEQGTGLGLIICKEFIERNSGTIRVESNPGIGCNFIITIPLKANLSNKESEVTDISKDTPFRDLSIEPQEIPATPLTDKLILLVEDNPVIRQNIKEYLSAYCRVIEAENGKEGFIIALETIPDLIVSDVMMPESDGIELCGKIKIDIRTNHIPVILLTASDSETNRMSGLENGADDYILKPFNAEVLRLRIFNLIRLRDELRKKYKQEIISPQKSSKPSIDEAFLQKVVNTIENNIYKSEFSVEDLSREINMSYIQFYRKIESLTGQAPGELMRLIRLKKAAELLEKNNGNISQTAYEAGFRDPSYFAKSFKKQFGVSPTDYLKSKIEKNVNDDV